LRREEDRLYLIYPTLNPEAPQGYVKPAVMLEFGARSTGEPTEVHQVGCDAAAHLPTLSFPKARPRVMTTARTFWEKATAAHVYCRQQALKQERFSRHWHDLAAIMKSSHFPVAINNGDIAEMVARHKSLFFKAKDNAGEVISYEDAVRGKLQLVPGGDALSSLKSDYAQMIEAGLFHAEVVEFETLMGNCAEMQERINRARSPKAPEAN
jgi:hypothetical protein